VIAACIENGTLQCIVKHLVDEVLSSSTSFAHIPFVSQSTEKMSEEQPEKSLNPMDSKPPSLSNVKHKYFLNCLEFLFSEDSKTLSLKHLDAFCGFADSSFVAFDNSGKHFLSLASGPFYPVGQEDEKNQAMIAEQEKVEEDPIDPELLKQINEQLSKYTSEEEVNPYSVIDVEKSLNEDDDVEDSKTQIINIFSKNSAGRFELSQKKSLQSLQFLCSNPVSSNFGLKYGVDMVIFQTKEKKIKMSRFFFSTSPHLMLLVTCGQESNGKSFVLFPQTIHTQ